MVCGRLRRFFRGLVPILLKQVPYTVVQLTTFQTCVEALRGVIGPNSTPSMDLALTFGCGTFAGVVGAIASHPADTLLSLVSARASEQVSVWQTARSLSARQLWAGIGARCVMVGGLSAVMFLVYDSARLALRLPVSGK
jgi:solute carrier family 25 (mitochondrial phosphate transporter), member 3